MSGNSGHLQKVVSWSVLAVRPSIGLVIACSLCCVSDATGNHQLVVVCSNFQKLSPNVQKRLAVENDDKATQWSITDLLPLHKKIGQ